MSYAQIRGEEPEEEIDLTRPIQKGYAQTPRLKQKLEEAELGVVPISPNLDIVVRAVANKKGTAYIQCGAEVSPHALVLGDVLICNHSETGRVSRVKHDAVIYTERKADVFGSKLDCPITIEGSDIEERAVVFDRAEVKDSTVGVEAYVQNTGLKEEILSEGEDKIVDYERFDPQHPGALGKRGFIDMYGKEVAFAKKALAKKMSKKSAKISSRTPEREGDNWMPKRVRGGPTISQDFI